MDSDKQGPFVKYRTLRNLASFFKRRQFCFELNPLMVVEKYKVINELSCMSNGLRFVSSQAFGLEYSEEVFSHSVIIAISSS